MYVRLHMFTLHSFLLRPDPDALSAHARSSSVTTHPAFPAPTAPPLHQCHRHLGVDHREHRHGDRTAISSYAAGLHDAKHASPEVDSLGAPRRPAERARSGHRLKVLVWFWRIDETLCANLFDQV
jgi:hypothetical protein